MDPKNSAEGDFVRNNEKGKAENGNDYARAGVVCLSSFASSCGKRIATARHEDRRIRQNLIELNDLLIKNELLHLAP